MLEIKHQSDAKRLTVLPRGRIDTATAGQFEGFLSGQSLARDQQVLVDLGAVEFVSSAGLRVFLMLAKRAQREGFRLVLTRMAPGVKQVFDISGFSKMFKIAAAAEQAEALFG